MIVVDTSVLIDFLAGRGTAAAEQLHRLEQDGVPYTIPAVCCQELLQGANNEDEWNLLQEYLETQHILGPTDPWTTHLGAARLYFDCRRQGITVRSTIDCLIAQMVLEADGCLLHNDRDFEHLQRVCPLRTFPT